MSRLIAAIDRLEGDWAVLLFQDSGLKATIPVALLPPGVREGDILSVTIKPEPEATRRQKKKIEGRLHKLTGKHRPLR